MGLWTKGCLWWCQLSRLQTLSKLHRRRVDAWVCHDMITSILISIQFNIYIYVITFGIYQLQPLQGLCEHRQGEGSASSQARIEGRDVGGQPWLEDTLPPTWHIYISGLVSSRNPDRSLNHCWRFIRRADPFQWFKVVFKPQMHYNLILSVPR